MDLTPATLSQVLRARDGRLVAVDDDVLGVVRDLREIDPSLLVRFSEAGEYFVVYRRSEAGGEQLVLTASELDQRIVERVRQIDSPDYDYVSELDRKEAQADRARDHKLTEHVGEVGQRLAHALRKDRGYDKQRIYVP